MKSVFLYYKKTIEINNLSSPIDRLVYQDKVLNQYCAENQWNVLKRFTDLGYLGTPFKRPELIQMKKVLGNPRYKPSTLLFYNSSAVQNELNVNSDLLLDIVEQIGEVHFYEDNKTVNYDRLRLDILGPRHLSLYSFKKTFSNAFDKKSIKAKEK
ncbi:hypothetical protein LCL89_09645 [Halobacillus yeomjeoni]|uniref:hypothetical protein n=1 Tax=Halobacillus yeomjeoni TaxID=311194 RepID=UPI001CD333B1|nr:hypothetical protein [Halobacillus yeomjeoni]MCA0984308.1 hypothetical protein [Halobacillus yeomjeoni]